MSVLSVLLLALLLTQQDKAPEGCRVSGTVVDSVTGEPLGKTQIVLTPQDRSDTHTAITTSDSKGAFTLVDVEAGRYRLYGKRSGYLESFYGARRVGGDGTVIQLQDGQALADLKLKLVPGAVLSGTVRDSDGEPLAEAHVVLGRRTSEFGRVRAEGRGGMDTDDLGQYRFPGLEPGQYYISVETGPPGWGRVDHSPRADGPVEAVVSTVYPGVHDLALAAPIEVTASARVTGIDVTMVRSRVFRVSGRVEGHRATDRVTVVLTERGSGIRLRDFPIRTITRNGAGDFEFRGVPPGSYLLTAGEALMPLDVRVSDVEGLRVRPASLPTYVEGHVTVEGKYPTSASGLRFTLSRNCSGSGDCDTGLMARTDDDHVFVTGRLAPDHYSVEFMCGRCYIKSMRWGQTDVLAEGLDVPVSGQVSLEIVIASDVGTVEGSVLDADEHAVVGAAVALVPEPKLRGRADRFQTTTTDQYGHFELRDVPPGDYKVFAWDDVEDGAWTDPEFLQKYEKQGEAVVLDPKGHAAVKVHTLAEGGK